MDMTTLPGDEIVTEDALPATRARWLSSALVCALGFLMITLDSTAVNIILPHVQTALHMADGDRQWTMTGFTLVFGAFLVIGGRIVDRIGPRPALVIGALGFGAVSTLTGMVDSAAMLIAGRAVTALFGTLLAPATLAVLNETSADMTRRARGFAIYGALSAFGGPGGLLIGGYLTEHFSWRPVLWINGVLGLLVALAALAILDAGRSGYAHARTRFDLAGAFLVTVGLAALLFGLSRLGGAASAVPALGLPPLAWCAIGVSALVLFVLVEKRHPAPILPFELLNAQGRGATLIALALIAGSFMGVAILMSFYVQNVLQYPPELAGLALLPSTVGALLGPALTGILVPRLGAKRTWFLGAASLFAGGLILSMIQLSSSYFLIVMPGDFLAGLGLGLSMMPCANILLYGVPRELNGAASGINNATIQISAAVVTTLFNAMFVAFASGAPGPGAVTRGYSAAFVTECVAAAIAGALILWKVRDVPRRVGGHFDQQRAP